MVTARNCYKYVTFIKPLPFILVAISYLRFWNHVFTCVSVRLSLAASSWRSWTLRYFCFSNDFSKFWSCESENAVRAFLGFLGNELYCNWYGFKLLSSSSSSSSWSRCFEAVLKSSGSLLSVPSFLSAIALWVFSAKIWK